MSDARDSGEDGYQVEAVDRGGPHDWSDETLEDGSRWCNDPGCAMFKWPDGSVAPFDPRQEADCDA